MNRKNVLFTVLICGIMMSFVISACSKDENHLTDETADMQLRAAKLGFTDENAYTEYVVQQCAVGNHENCCHLNEDGTHQVCLYPNHLGENCKGGHHQGGKHLGQNNKFNCTAFVDANGDGICDNCTGICTGDGTHKCGCTAFVDANSDGVCDNCTGDGTGNGAHKCDCTAFVDANSDGICDNCTGDCTHQHHNRGGGHHGKR